MGNINVAIIGVGNCASSLVQGIYYYKRAKETEFVNLSRLKFDPCRGCCHLCAPNRICGIKDGLHPYLPLVRDAEALVLGTPYQMGHMTGFMFNFLTRLEGFHHVKPALYNKPAVLISAGCKKKEVQIEQGIPRFERLVKHTDQIKPLGHIYYNAKSPPCLRCGEGQHCTIGGYYKYVLDFDKDKLDNTKISTDLIQNWEDSPQIVEEIDNWGKVLAEL